MKEDPAYKDSSESTPTAVYPDIMNSKQAGKDNAAVRGCEFMRAPPQELSELRSLPSSAIILLLTPIVASPQRQTDPFEPLGRAISRRHSRVRHVPYVAKIGFTDTHQAFMKQADAIIIASIDAPPPSTFGDSNSDMADSVFEFVTDAPSVPTAVIQFGGPTVKLNEDSNELYLRASHASSETFALATCLLFGGDA